MQESFYESGNCVQIICAIQGVHPKHFSPTSDQLKSEINGAFLCKRHQKQHLEFCTTLLRTRRLGVRVPPGAPPIPSFSFTYRRPLLAELRQGTERHENVILCPCRTLAGWLFPDSAAPAPPSPVGSGAWFPDSNDASLAAPRCLARPN